MENIIDLWPSPTEFAADIGTTAANVYTMRRRGIPPKYWPKIIASAKRRKIKGITLDCLAELHERRKEPKELTGSACP